MKHLKLFFALFAMLALGVGNAWGATITINGSASGITTTDANQTITVDGITFKGNFKQYSTTALWFTSGSGYIYNTTSLGTINSITINYKSGGSGSSKQYFTSGTSEITSYQDGTAQITTSTGGTAGTHSSFSGGFFNISISNKNLQATSIVIDYTPAGGGETPGEGEEPTPDPEEPGEDGDKDGETYELVTSISDLEAGAKYIVGNSASTSSIFMSTATNTNNRKVTSAITITDNKVTITEDVLILELGGETGAWTFKTTNYIGTQGFLTSAASGTNNHCKVVATAENCSYFTIAFNDQEATITSTGRNERNILRYNSSSSLFACYSSGQSPVYLYKLTTSSGGDEGGSEEPVASLTANPTSLDFRNVTQNNEVEAKTFTISGSDFTTGELTITAPSGYTVNPTTVPVNGTLEETTITVTPNTSTVGTFNDNVTISGANLKSSVNVALSMTVEKAPATPTGNVYVKVTSTAGITDGEYLIVYEDASNATPEPVAFNGALATEKLDVASNNIEVSIASNTIAGNTDIDAATFTINTAAGTIQTKDGYYIGQTSNANGLTTSTTTEYTNTISIENDGSATIISSGGAYLRYNSANDNLRFRYFKSSTYTAQKAIALYKKVDPNAVVEPVFTLAAGEYYGTQSVEITCATAGAEIYYTLNGTDPTSASTKYTGAISIASTTTVKAIAVKGANSSTVVSATYTILAPLATMQEIFDKATAVGGTATPVHITMNKWVITGVKGSNAYLTDGTKGLIIYTASHGFNVGDILSGTVACKVQLYKGSAELTELTATTEGLTITTGGAVSPIEVTDITTLGGVNTGSVIKVTGPCTVNGTKYYVAGLELYNSLFAYTNPEAGFNYECAGVYVQFDATQEILPRKAEDLVKIETQQPAGIAFAAAELTAEVGATDFEEPELTNPNSLTVTYKTSDATLATVNATTGEVTIGNKAGKVTITASFAGSEDYVAATASYNITISDPNQLEATFVAGTDKSDTQSISKNGITVEFTGGVFDRTDNYRCYAGQSMTISYADGQITKIVIECTANDEAEYGPGQFTTETATYSYSGKVGTWTGEANSVTFTNIKQVRMTAITVYYKQDNRAEAGLAWNPATVSLTVGDAFTAPTFNNPNNLAPISFNSDNTALATVNNAGVISLKASAVGTATITATFAGNDIYKDAEVKCTITVNPKTEKVVILAQYNGQWYALQAAYFSTYTNRLAAIPVNYVGGKLYNVEEGDKATIEWQLAVSGTKATFKNGENYLTGANGTDLKLGTATFEWDYNGELFLTDGDSRTFIYHKDGYFRNYATSNAIPNSTTYSNKPVVTAPDYATGDAYGRSVNLGEDGYRYGTICLPFGSTNFTGAEFFECVGKEEGKVYLGSVTTLVAGTPYIFLASATEVAVYGNGTTAATAGNSNGLYGTFDNNTVVAADGNNYILFNNELCLCAAECYVNANRAYIKMDEVPTGVPTKMPGRRYIGMSVEGENEATGFENITAPAGKTVKAIVNGQLIIIRDGEMYNAQGQKL